MAAPSLAETAMDMAQDAKDTATSALAEIRIHTAECNLRQKTIIERLEEGKSDRQGIRNDIKAGNEDLHKRVSGLAKEVREGYARFLWWIVGVLVMGAFALIGTIWWLLKTYAFVQPPA